MSRFYASIQDSRGEATRMGTPNSGIEGHIRGWNVGARVVCFMDDEGQDKVAVYLTSGSSYKGLSKTLGVFTEADLKPKDITFDSTAQPGQRVK